MRFASKVVLTAGVLAGLVSAACGGGGGATTAPTATSTPPTATAGPTAPGSTMAPASPTARPTPAPNPTATTVPIPTGQLRLAASFIAGWGLAPGITWNKLHIDPMYDPLVGMGADGQPNTQSGLASSWQVGSDGKSWTIKTRPGLRFQNGEVATAQDFKYSVDFYNGPDSNPTGSNNATRAKYIEKTDAPDDATVVISLKTFNVFTLIDTLTLASFGTSGGYLLPKAYFQAKTPAEANKNPIGSGPYRYKNSIVNQQLDMEAVPGAHWYYGVPRYATAQASIVGEDGTRVALLKTGGLEAIEVPIANLNDVRAGTDIVTEPTMARSYAVRLHDQFNPGPLSKPQVRQAMSLVIDRDLLTKQFTAGVARPTMDSVVWPTDPAYKAHPVPARDLAKAKSLIAQGGYPNGFTLDFYFFTSRGIAVIGPQIAEAIAVWWQELGITVDRKPTDSTTLLPLIRKHAQPGPYASTGWVSAFGPHSGGAIPGGTRLKDVTLRDTEDADIEAAGLAMGAATDLPSYINAAQRYQELYYERFIDVPLMYLPEVYAVKKGLGGESWKYGRSVFGINFAGLLTRPDRVR